MYYFLISLKSLLIISNFLRKDKVIVSNWYQNLDDKLIRECVRIKINIKILVVAKRLYEKNPNRQNAYRHKEKP